MDEPVNADTTRLERHGRKASEVDADRVEIQFGPDVMRELKRLEETVRGKEDFDDDMRHLLQRLISGKPVPLNDALTWLTALGRDTSEYVHATGDRDAESALDLITAHLMGQSPDAKPVTVFVEPKAKIR